MLIEMLRSILLPQLKETARAAWITMGTAAQAGAAMTANKVDDVIAKKVFGDDELFNVFYDELETQLLHRFFGGNTTVLEEVRTQLNLPPVP